jgi:hypothetical protein
MKEIIIPIAPKLRSDYDGYSKFLLTYNKLKSVENSTITFDFKLNTWLEANLCAVFGALIEVLEENNNKIDFINMGYRLEDTLSRNGFLELFKKSKKTDYNNTILSYQRYNPKDDEIFNNYVKEELLNKPDFPKHTVKAGKKISESIFEIYENARTHGKCNFIHICGQYYPNKEGKPLHITIVDRGISIRRNVNEHFKKTYKDFKSISAKEAIDWAVFKGNTTKIGIPGGLGLDIIIEFVKLNKGKIQIISSNGYWEYDKEVSMQSFDFPFIGTIVNIKFNLSDDSVYYLVDEEDYSLENLF